MQSRPPRAVVQSLSRSPNCACAPQGAVRPGLGKTASQNFKDLGAIKVSTADAEKPLSGFPPLAHPQSRDSHCLTDFPWPAPTAPVGVLLVNSLGSWLHQVFNDERVLLRPPPAPHSSLLPIPTTSTVCKRYLPPFLGSEFLTCAL